MGENMPLRPMTALLLLAAVCPAESDRERYLLDKIASLEARLTALEKRVGSQDAGIVAAPAVRGETRPGIEPPAIIDDGLKPAWRDTTASFYFDGYYSWNSNRPFTRSNPLRAYDGTASAFSVNQTGFVLESTPRDGRRWGYRLDLMYGQATETLQGSVQNESRPYVYRNLFQAYGTYALPVGGGVTMDFGKWAGALGPEGNYTKDQINYSRSYFFNFLPFYHMGLRATAPVNDRLSLTYWLANGANQTEDFNGFKSQLAQAVVRPAKSVTWTLNYYSGREQRDFNSSIHGGPAGLPAGPIQLPAAPRGRLHILDTYAFWKASDKLTLGGEVDYVVNRVEADGPPQRVTGGAAYLRYQLSPRLYFGQRYVRLNDRGGLFSGSIQNLNDVTSTLGYRPADGFEVRLEFRRDFSNRPFFPGRNPVSPSRHQSTVSLGLLWWFGGRSGTW